MRKALAILFFFSIAACAPAKKTVNTPAVSQTVVDGKLWSTLFQQKAAEYAALCYQAYNIAHTNLIEIIAKNKFGKPLAVITDIDETILDNSSYAVYCALLGKDYEANTWAKWTAKGIATPLPGSLDFFNDAASKNVTIFYITNRDEKERPGTLANLKKYKFPFADNEHLILKNKESSKEPRRRAIAQTYNIVMLLGDNLSDFSSLWDKKTSETRVQNVEAQAANFGTRFIILPNITYGGWEDAIYGNKYNLTPAQKDSAIKANVKGY